MMKLKQLLEYNYLTKQYIAAIDTLHIVVMDNEKKLKEKISEIAETDNTEARNIWHQLHKTTKMLEDLLKE